MEDLKMDAMQPTAKQNTDRRTTPMGTPCPRNWSQEWINLVNVYDLAASPNGEADERP